MKCLRSGYCCINYDVVIVTDPKLGIVEGNAAHKPAGEPCPHLIGSKPGKYSCAIHAYPWYKQTPCYEFTQIEQTINSPCRMGEYVLNHEKVTA